MSQNVIRFCSKSALICLNVSLIALAIFVVITGGLLWRLSSGPLDISFAKESVQQALNQYDYNIEMEALALEWTDLKGPLLLDMGQVSVAQEDAQTNLSVDHIGLGISRSHLFIGQIRPVSVLLSGISLQLIMKDGDVDLRIQDQDIETQADQMDNDTRQKIIVFFSELAGANSDDPGFLSVLDELKIEEANLSLQDLDKNTAYELTDLNVGLRRFEKGLVASLDIETEEEGKIGLDVTYRKQEKDFLVAGYVQNFDIADIGQFSRDLILLEKQDFIFSAEATANFDPLLNLQKADMSLRAPKGSVFWPEEYDAPIAFSNMEMAVSYQGKNRMLSVETTLEIEGIPTLFEGDAIINADSIDAPITVTVPKVAVEKIGPLFPKSEQDGEAAKWLNKQLSLGTFSDVVVMADIQASQDEQSTWQWALANERLNFAFDGLKVQYSETLMPAEDAKGTGVFDFEDDALYIHGDSARIGEITTDKAMLTFTDIMVEGGGFADIKYEASGSLATAFLYISDEPISFGEKLGFDPFSVEGKIDVTGHITFPTVKDLPKEEVGVSLDAVLTDVNIPDVVKGLPLTGGPLKLKTGEGFYRVTGQAKLAGRDTVLDWKQYFDSDGRDFEAQVKANIGVDKELRHHFNIDLDEYISGTLPVDLIYTDRGDNSAVIDVKGDLTPIKIHIEPFQYIKDAGISGDVQLKGLLKNDVLQELSGVTLKTKDLSISDTKLAFRSINKEEVELWRGQTPTAIIGKTVMNAEFEITPAGTLKVSAKGPVFDAGPFLADKEDQARERGMPLIVSLTADKMLTKKDRFVERTKLYADLDAYGYFNQMEMDARAGNGDIYLRYKPDAEGKRIFRMEADDAGAFLRAFDLYEDMIGGTFSGYGEPKENKPDGDVFGKYEIKDFKIVGAPALARLIAAMSLTDLPELLNGEGLSFTKLESNYEWRFRPEGSLLMIKEGRTSGSSLGLTYKGTVDRANGEIDISGTIVPISGVNSMLADIPLIGDILGGDSGIIAATYTMKGPANNATVAINPLSVLAPGFLRTILFEGGDVDSESSDAPEKKENDINE